MLPYSNNLARCGKCDLRSAHFFRNPQINFRLTAVRNLGHPISKCCLEVKGSLIASLYQAYQVRIVAGVQPMCKISVTLWAVNKVKTCWPGFT